MTLGFMLFFIALEFLLPREPFKFLKKGFWTDLIWYTLMQGIILQILVFKYVGQFYDAHSFHLISNLPLWLQCIILIVFMDFVDYWMHRLSHNWFPLWRTHEVHHSTVELNWLSGSRIHALEMVMVRVIGGALIAVMGVSEYALYVMSVADTFMGMFTHSNLKINLGPLKYIFNSPEMHRVHHLNKTKHQFSNFANKFAFWDWLFGTASLPGPEVLKDAEYGIGYHYPQNPFSQFIYMFRKKGDDA
jgi:sterol desaturase/sphingolipid hydroxylase (fatty acid hydroxylase superfamily)